MSAGAEKKDWCNAEGQRTKENAEYNEALIANNAAVDQFYDPSQYQRSPEYQLSEDEQIIFHMDGIFKYVLDFWAMPLSAKELHEYTNIGNALHSLF